MSRSSTTTTSTSSSSSCCAVTKPSSSYCDHSGWGSKKGRIVKTWKRRYFVLKGVELIYFAGRSASGKGLDEKGRMSIAGVEFTPEVANALIITGALKNQAMVVSFEGNGECSEWHSMMAHALRSANGAAARKHARSDASRIGGHAIMEGWLTKEGQNFKSWKRRYMALHGRMLRYHAEKGEPPLGEVYVSSVNLNASRKFALDVYSDNNRILRVSAASFEEIAAWDRALATVCGTTSCFGDTCSDQPAPFLGMDSIMAVDCEGWLYVRGQRSSVWKKHYFTFAGSVLKYMDHPGERAREDGSVVELKLTDNLRQLEIKLDTGRWLMVVSDSEEEANKWVWKLCDHLGVEPSELGDGVERPRPGSAMASRLSTVSSDSGGHGRGSEDGSMVVRKTGWLMKEGQRRRSWKKRYFVLEGSQLVYYDNSAMRTRKGEGLVSRIEMNVASPNGILFYLTGGRVLQAQAGSFQEARGWADVYNGTVTQNNSDMSAMCSTTLSAESGSSGSSEERDPLEFGRGWLLKEGKNFKTWKQRYFTLHGRQLTYSSAPSEAALGRGVIKTVKLGRTRPFCMEVTLVQGRLLTLVAASEADMLAWCASFRSALEFEATGVEFHPLDVVEFDEDGDEEMAAEVQRSPPELAMMTMGLELDADDVLDDLATGGAADDALAIVPHVNSNLVVCSGWLRKEGGTVKTWKERFFTLYGTVLRYYKTESGPLLGNFSVCHVLIVHTRKHCFKLTTTSGRNLVVLAESESIADRWLRALRSAIDAARESSNKLKLQSSMSSMSLNG